MLSRKRAVACCAWHRSGILLLIVRRPTSRRYVATWLVNSGSPYYTFVIIDLEKLIMTNYCIPFEVTSALLWDKEGKNVIFATDFAPEDQTIGRATVLFNLEQDRAFVLAEGVVPRMWWFPE